MLREDRGVKNGSPGERRRGSDGARREESLRMVRKEKDEMWTDWTHAARERQFVPALFTLEAMKGNNSR